MLQGELTEILGEIFLAMESAPVTGGVLIIRVVITFSSAHLLLKVRRQRHREGSICTLPFDPGLTCGGRICRLVEVLMIFLCAVLCLVHQSCPTLCDLMVCCQPGSSVHGLLQGTSFPSPGDLPNPGIKPRSPALQADSLPIEPPGEPKNSGVGGLSLLQGIFLTQE